MSKININKTAVGERLKSIRLSKGMTLEEFGSLFGAEKSNVSKWEKGKSIPSPDRLNKIAKISDISVDELLYGNEDSLILELLKDFENELTDNPKISNKLIPIIINDMREYLFPSFFKKVFKDSHQLIDFFNTRKEKIIEQWSTPESIESQLIQHLDYTLRNSIQDTVPYFYEDFLNDSDEISDKRITSDSQLYIRRLQELADFISAYMDAIRFKDNEDIQKELDKLKEFQKTIDQRMLS